MKLYVGWFITWIASAVFLFLYRTADIDVGRNLNSVMSGIANPDSLFSAIIMYGLISCLALNFVMAIVCYFKKSTANRKRIREFIEN